MLVMIKACVVPIRNEFPGGQLNELGWITYCQGCHVCEPQHQAETLPLEGSRIRTLPFSLSDEDLENAQELMANQNELGRTPSVASLGWNFNGCDFKS